MNETAKGAARSAADDRVYARLEKDLAALKNDVAHLSQQISEAVNALGAVAQRQARRGLKNAGQSVVSLMTVAPDRAVTVENAAQDPVSSVGEAPAGVIAERDVAPPAFGLGPRSRPSEEVGYLTPAAYAAATCDRLRNPDQLRRSHVAPPAPHGVKPAEALIAAG